MMSNSSLFLSAIGDLELAAVALVIFNEDVFRSRLLTNFARIVFGIAVALTGLIILLDTGTAFSFISGIVYLVAGAGILIHTRAKEASFLLAAWAVLNLFVFVLPFLADSPIFLSNLARGVAFLGAALIWAGIFWRPHQDSPAS